LKIKRSLKKTKNIVLSAKKNKKNLKKETFEKIENIK
jgi:hypothetical protein